MLLCILGARGRLGSTLYALAKEDPSIPSIYPASRIRQEGFLDREIAIEKSDVIIDVSSFESTKEHLKWALAHKKPIVIGTTGHKEPIEKILEDAAQSIPIFYTSNFSLGIALAAKMVSYCDRAIGEKTVRIEEVHHIHKKDKPSGTALFFSQLMQEKPEIISHRIEEAIGTHSVTFSFEEEVLTLSHEVLSRKVFAKGALNAARFLITKPPGLYGMNDLIDALVVSTQ